MSFLTVFHTMLLGMASPPWPVLFGWRWEENSEKSYRHLFSTYPTVSREWGKALKRQVKCLPSGARIFMASVDWPMPNDPCQLVFSTNVLLGNLWTSASLLLSPNSTPFLLSSHQGPLLCQIQWTFLHPLLSEIVEHALKHSLHWPLGLTSSLLVLLTPQWGSSSV